MFMASCRAVEGKVVPVLNSLCKKVVVTVAVAAGLGGLVPSGIAHAALDCHFSFSTNVQSCNGPNKKSSDVIGARLFTGTNYTGDMLTVWVPRPCRNDQKIDHILRLYNSPWRNRVGSLQPMGNCWIELYDTSGNREGPYDDLMADVTTIGGSSAYRVGLA